MQVVKWVESHPWETGGLVLVGGVALLYVFGAFGGSSPATSGTGEDPNVAAYLNAEAQQNAAGDELQAIQDQDQAATAQAGINANANVDINNLWATAGVDNTQNTNTATTQQDLINQLGGVANNLGTTLNSSWNTSAQWGGSQGGGLTGLIFGSSSSTASNSQGGSSQSFVQNQEQGEAVGLLGQITQSEFNAGN